MLTAPAIASLIPAAVYVSLEWAPDFWDAWLARAVTNAVASMTLVPPFVVAGQFLLSKPVKVPRRVVEFGLLLIGIIEGNLKALLGYRDRDIDDSLAGWMRLVAPADRGKVQSRLDAFTSGAIGTFDAEFRMTRRDGSLGWIASKGAVTDGVGGTATRLRGTYADVTERKQSDRALRDATDALVRTWRISAMTELSASLAHELNQPLTAIITNVNACRQMD